MAWSHDGNTGSSIKRLCAPESIPATAHISGTHWKLIEARSARARGGSRGNLDISRPSTVMCPSAFWSKTTFSLITCACSADAKDKARNVQASKGTYRYQ